MYFNFKGKINTKPKDPFVDQVQENKANFLQKNYENKGLLRGLGHIVSWKELIAIANTISINKYKNI